MRLVVADHHLWMVEIHTLGQLIAEGGTGYAMVQHDEPGALVYQLVQLLTLLLGHLTYLGVYPYKGGDDEQRQDDEE